MSYVTSFNIKACGYRVLSKKVIGKIGIFNFVDALANFAVETKILGCLG